MNPQPTLNLPINRRALLLTVDTVAASRGVTPESVYEDVDSGRLLWVWNVAADFSGPKRELRFFAQEVIAPEFARQQKLNDVIKLLVPQREWLRNWELEHLLAVRRPTLLALRDELRAQVVDNCVRIHRNALVSFFMRRIVR